MFRDIIKLTSITYMYARDCLRPWPNQALTTSFVCSVSGASCPVYTTPIFGPVLPVLQAASTSHGCLPTAYDHRPALHVSQYKQLCQLLLLSAGSGQNPGHSKTGRSYVRYKRVRFSTAI